MIQVEQYSGRQYGQSTNQIIHSINTKYPSATWFSKYEIHSDTGKQRKSAD